MAACSELSAFEDEYPDSTYLAFKHCKNLYFASPDMRNIYLKYAQECYENKKFSLSAYYQLQALCFSHKTKNHFEYINLKSQNYNFELNERNEDHSNELLDYAKKTYLSEQSSIPIKVFDTEKEIESMNEFIKILPKEWTVIHVCKGYNVNMTISTKTEILTAEIPLFLTIITHPRSEEYPDIQPIISLKCNDTTRGFYEIYKNFKDIISFNFDGTRSKQQYAKDLKIFDNDITERIKSLIRTIGPWVCLLTGNVQRKDVKIQQKFFAEVDAFCNEFNLSNFSRILLSMLVPHLKYLTKDDIKDATSQLNKDGNSELSNKIFNFLINQKSETYKFSLTPCILIVDELLDHFPWEMLNTTQEICRISSFNILKQLYMKYKNKILNGYLHIEVKNGNCIINPEKNLEAMEKRMKLFFSYWLPHWNCIYSDKPTEEKIQEIFSSEGIYVYCGHGSGIKYLNNYETEIKRIAKSVAFLFGCDSVKLRSAGLHAEFKGDHLYFHAGLCPAIVGLLNIGLDFALDTYATKILSTWIPSKNKAHWSTFNKLQWRKAGILVNEANENKFKYEPKLAAILCDIRSDSSQKMYNKITLVYRGLPVWNKTLQ